jgi:hypothetical protein
VLVWLRPCLQGWCFTYTCQKRLSTFWTYLPAGHTVPISFRATPAQVFRLWWPYAESDDELVLVIDYLRTPNRRFVWLPDVGRKAPEAKPPTIGDNTGHGAFYWDQNSTLLYVKMKGGQKGGLEVRTEAAVMVSGRSASPACKQHRLQPAAAGLGC